MRELLWPVFDGPGDLASIEAVPSATEVAALFHTGGRTGTPKLAAHTALVADRMALISDHKELS